MKGWLFVTSSGQVDFRTEEFLFQCPGFFSDNAWDLLGTKRFDTEDLDAMADAFAFLRPIQPRNEDLLDLCRRMDFEFSTLKAHMQAKYASNF